jgi:signal transduction histidine kinase
MATQTSADSLMKRIRFRLYHQILLSHLFVALSGVVLVGVSIYVTARTAIEQRAFAQLTSVRANKQSELETWFAEKQGSFASLAAHPKLQEWLEGWTPKSPNPEPDEAVAQLLGQFKLTQGVLHIWLCEAETGSPLLATDRAPALLPLPRIIGADTLLWHRALLAGRQSPVLTDLGYLQPGDTSQIVGFMVMPIGQSGLVLAAAWPTTWLDNILNQRIGLGQSGETYLVGTDHRMRSQSRFTSQPTVLRQLADTRAVLAALSGTTGTDVVADYRGVAVLSAYEVLELADRPWVLLAEIDEAEVMEPAKLLLIRSVLLVLGFSVFIMLAAFWFAGSLSKPIRQLSENLRLLALGKQPTVMPKPRSDEIGEMEGALQQLVQAYQNQRQFASELGTGNFEAQYELLSPEDALGQALLQMRDDLADFRALQDRQAEVRTRAILDGQEVERRRLARELHDGIGQLLTAINFAVTSLPDHPAKASLRDLIDTTRTELRNLSNNLMPSVLIDFGLEAALRLLTQTARQHSNAEVTLEYLGDNHRRFAPETEIALFRIAQEALNNALKYAQATRISLTVQLQPESLRLRVQDTGRGFDPTQLERTAGSTYSGLRNMRQRAEVLGGSFDLQTQPGVGACITVVLPITQPIPVNNGNGASKATAVPSPTMR